MGSSSKEEPATDADNSSGDALPSDTSLFSEGERVQAYHECFSKGKWKSLLWLGYLANSWDEWVGVDRLLKRTEDNATKQQALEEKQGVDKTSKSGRSTQTKLKGPAGSRGKKRKSNSVIEKDNSSVEKLVKIQIPSALKKQLVDEWEFVSQQDKLVILPRSPSVDDILMKYLEYRSKKDGIMVDSVREILKGIRCYFDKALPVMLLSKKKRQQYQEAVLSDASPSTIYGAEHLPRLFVKLPELLADANVEEETLTNLQQKLLDFLQYHSTCSRNCWIFTSFCKKIRAPFSFLVLMGPKVRKVKGK